MRNTTRYALAPAAMVAFGVLMFVDTDTKWTAIAGTIATAAIFYALYSILDRNPAAEADDE